MVAWQVESFFQAHGGKLQLKLEGKRVGFDRKIREPTINRPGLALSGFYSYFAEKRVHIQELLAKYGFAREKAEIR